MKKLIYCAAIALVAFTSCDKNNSNSNASADESALGKQYSEAFGEMVGASLNENAQRMKEMNPEFWKKFKSDEYAKGVEYVLAIDTANIGLTGGLSDGLGIRQQLLDFADKNGLPIDNKAFMAALRKALNDTTIKYGPARDKFSQIESKAIDFKSAANKKAGEELIKKKIAEGYKKTESGLVYKIEKPGEGKVAENTPVKVNYTGTLTSGKVFDSSNGQPREFSPAGVVPGFKEALLMLGKGGKMTAVLPADIAYGAMGQGAIGPNETLTFEIEVVDILPAVENPAPAIPGTGTIPTQKMDVKPAKK